MGQKYNYPTIEMSYMLHGSISIVLIYTYREDSQKWLEFNRCEIQVQ